MKDPLLVILAILGLAVFYVMLPVFWNVYTHYRKIKAVDCPAKNQKAFIGIDAKRAGLTATVGYEKLQVKDCTLWKGERFCNQECLSRL